MTDQSFPVELDKIAGLEGLDDAIQVVLKQSLQFSIADITGCDQEQFVWLAPQQEQVHKILILGDNYTLFT